MPGGGRSTITFYRRPELMAAWRYAHMRLARIGRCLEELAAADELLDHHAGDADHGEAAVVQLLGLHLGELLGVGGLEARRVEAEVAGDVVGADGPRLVAGRALEGENAEDLDDRDEEDDGRPEGLQRRLLEGDVRRHVDAAAEERVELLGDRVAEGGEHGDAAVLDLDLAVEA